MKNTTNDKTMTLWETIFELEFLQNTAKTISQTLTSLTENLEGEVLQPQDLKYAFRGVVNLSDDMCDKIENIHHSTSTFYFNLKRNMEERE